MPDEPKSKSEKAAILKEARSRFQRVREWEAKTRINEDADTKFAEGDSYNDFQWPSNIRAERDGRPCLTSNVVRQHNLLIVNDARKNKAQIKVTPTGGGATYEASQVFQGLIRATEYKSKAIDAYSTAIFHQVQRGIGYVRVRTDYVDQSTFDQEPKIERVADPKTIYLDPDAKEYDKSDMKWAFVFTDVPRDVYEARHGKNSAPFVALDDQSGWVAKDHVREAEYWRIVEEQDTLVGLSDGSAVLLSDVSREMIEAAGLQVVQEREVSIPRVEWFMLRGNDLVEEKEWPGRYIPIVPFVGEETVIDGVLDRKGHTRSMLDDQRMFNYWNSAAVEFVALQGKSPYMAPARAIEGHETYWRTANTANYSVLPWNDLDEDGQPVAKPERVQPPMMSQAYVEGMNIARVRIREVSGQYQAEQGAPSNERSGVAIQARQRQGDLATYHFIDNQAKGIRQVGRILIDLYPRIYDTARVIKILAEDGVTQSDVQIDPTADAAHQHVAMTPQGPQPIAPDQAAAAANDEGSQLDVRVIFNPGVGDYDVQADVGPSYGTQRQEAFNAFQTVIQAAPDLMKVAGDLLFDNGDFPGAQALAQRLKRGVPSEYLGGPSPELVQAQQQLQEMQHRLVAMNMQLTEAQQRLAEKSTKNTIDDYRAETDRLAAVGSVDPAALQIIVRQMVENMLGTPLTPMLQQHAAIEQSLAPPEPQAQAA